MLSRFIMTKTFIPQGARPRYLKQESESSSGCYLMSENYFYNHLNKNNLIHVEHSTGSFFQVVGPAKGFKQWTLFN